MQTYKQAVGVVACITPWNWVVTRPSSFLTMQTLIRQLPIAWPPNSAIAARPVFVPTASMYRKMSLMNSDIQAEAQHPERILVGHPMNPPHMIPMVELVPGRQTSKQAIKTAEAFYKNMQRVTILVQKELVGHLGGGMGGYEYYLDHLGPTQEARWKDHGKPRLTEEVKSALVAGVAKELKKQDQETLTQRRDAALVDLLKLKQLHGF